MVAHLDQSVPSSSVPFSLYKPNFLPLISLLSTEIYDQSAPIIFVRRSYRSAIASVINASLPSNFNLESILFPLLKIFMHFLFSRLCTIIIHYRPVRVLGSTITCRSCLVHQVTNRLFATRWTTMKCTHQVTKTLTI